MDEYLRDQLVVFQALAEGRSTVYGGKRQELVEPSLHARTAQWVTKEMLGVDFDDEGACEGIAYGPKAEPTEDLAQDLEKLDVNHT